MFLTKNIEKPKENQCFCKHFGGELGRVTFAGFCRFLPGCCRVAAGWWVPIWGRCLFGGCAEAETKQVRTPLSRASFVWGKMRPWRHGDFVVSADRFATCCGWQ